MQGPPSLRRRAPGPSRFYEEEHQAPHQEGSSGVLNSTRAEVHSRQFASGCWSIPGLLIYTSYLCSAVVYLAFRLQQLLLLHRWFWYGALVLAAETSGALAITLYGLCIIRRIPAVTGQQLATGAECSFTIHVLVPCYSEALDIVAETVWAAFQAQLPSGCTSTVWLLDDGCDVAKKVWVEGLGQEGIRYVNGRKRPKGEVNGKAGNLNSFLNQLYGYPLGAPDQDLVVIFDCDQVCQRDFFLKTLPLLNESDDVAMVLTPQQFGNVLPGGDIFNHTNRHFWEVMVPGLTAWGLVVCTGSNIVIRAHALQQVGYFPANTITEDFALGVELAKCGYRAAYLCQYLARGEAPEEGAVFRQRSRWCKGHLQESMSRDCPLLQTRLPWTLRLLFFSGTFSYLTAAFCTPLFIVVPYVAVAFKIFPVLLDPDFVYFFVPYFCLMHAVMYFCDSWGLLRALGFSSLATHILWYTYLKACWNTILSILGLKRRGCFKTTVKTGVNAAMAEEATSAPGTPGQLSRTITPSSLSGVLGWPAEPSSTPCHRSTASAPSFLNATLTAALKKTVKPIPAAAISVTATSRLMQTVETAYMATEADAGAVAPCIASRGEAAEIQRTLTMPALQRQISGGIRPGWNLQIASSLDVPHSPNASSSSQTSEAKSVQFERLRVRNISFGVLRDTWVPLVSFGISVWTIIAGLKDLCNGGPRMATIAVSILWAIYNCLGPYLLIHYTWIGRYKSLERASTVCMLVAISILASAAIIVWHFTPAQHNFHEVLGLSYQFYEAQQSGFLAPTNKIPFRGNSGLNDKAPNGSPLVGGWYDAGDHLKTSFSIAVSSSLLALGLMEFSKGHAMHGQLEIGHRNLRWAADYLLKCHTAPNEFVGQIGSMELDHAYWGRPEDMEFYNISRPAFLINTEKPGSDMAAQAAAALAASSKVFRTSDMAFSQLTLQHAKQLFEFAVTHQGLFAESSPEMGAVYPSKSWRDDAAWGAAWLYVASEDPKYLMEAQKWLSESKRHEIDRWQYYAVNWDNMIWSTHCLLARRAALPESSLAVSEFLDKWRLGEVVRYTPLGLAFSDDWGTLRNAANAALLALLHAKALPASEANVHRCWAISQMRYILGDGSRSFVVGYGRRPPLRPHHRAASCPSPPQPCNVSALHSKAENPNTLHGALVGGPDVLDRYDDNRTNYEKSEVGIEYNAGFTAALAALAETTVRWQDCWQLQDL